MYCRVALPIPSDQAYTYSVPEKFAGLVFRGQRVYVRVRGVGEPVVAYVVSVSENCEIDPALAKPIYDVVDGLAVPEDLIELAFSISEKYLCPIGSALELVFPSSLSFSADEVEEFFDFNRRADVFAALADRTITQNERLIAQYLFNSGARTIKEIERDVLSDRATIKRNLLKLAAARYVSSSFDRKSFEYREPSLTTGDFSDMNEMVYTDEQKAAISAARGHIEKNEYSEMLIFGVTGSGKTEVYIEILKKILEKGGGGIVLVPEIALTEHLKHRYLKAFPDCLDVWHSMVTRAEKGRIYSKIASGRTRILLGARSAVFAPFEKPACVIIDEEHDSSYKQDSGVRYDAREVSRMRMRKAGGLLVLGSATPSLETYHPLSAAGAVVEMKKRVENRPLPACHIVDMGSEFTVKKNKSIFSDLLAAKIAERIEKRQQVLLFLNRRGHSTFVLCRACGNAVRCESCSVSMTYHSEPPKLVCHYCDASTEVPKACPKCRSPYIRFFGVGTEKVEEEFRRRFPGVPVARLDSDVLSNKGASARIFDDFMKKKTLVLIGTQMIAKGLDFHNITLVGIVSADVALNMPDMFASEKTFQVLCQVIGRTGRGTEEGECVIQTYNPGHYSITAAASSDYSEFYRNEMEIRNGFFHPPVSKMVKVSFSHEQEFLAAETAAKVHSELAAAVKESGIRVELLGPAPALIARVQNVYRFNVFAFADGEELIRSALLSVLKKYSFTNKRQCVKITVDMCPNSTY